MLLFRLLDIYTWILVVRVIMSWVNASPYNPIVRIVYMLTEPILGPIRRVLPSMGGLDFSPMVVLVAIWMFKSLL